VHYIEAYLVKAMASTDSAIQEPMAYNEVKQGQESIQWMQAVKEEMDTLFKAGAYELVDLPQGHKALGVKWVFKLKFRADGTPERYKARLVVKGYAQVLGGTTLTHMHQSCTMKVCVYSWDLQHYWILISIKWL